MTQPKEYYRNKLSLLATLLKKDNQKRNGITSIKIILFLLFLFFIYTFTTSGNIIFLCAFFGAITLFIVMNIIESKLLRKISFLQELRKCTEVELEYLAGNRSHLATGDQYKDQLHPYAHDLDLFGEDSLFQSVNRTVTPHGRENLRQWLLNPLKSGESIRERQQAICELSDDPDWCLTFRSVGNSQQISSLNLQQIENWQQEQFTLPRWVIVFTYILPVFTVTTWILCTLSVITENLPLTLSIISLVCSYLPGKRTLLTHSHLDGFTRSFSNLYGLIDHYSTKTWKSHKLKTLHNQLFNETSDAKIALHSLQKIQEGFDQRTNVIVAIFMNALFMRELHLLRKLITWKQRYSASIHTWMQITAELDTLTSMANYQYNHPTFTIPTISHETLLRGTAIGHPLLTSDECVTNDFGIKHLHEFYVITGANMAGKSTFLRAVGVNLVLALCGSVVRASAFEFQPMGIFTSMRTVDNLAKGTSYFHAELLRLKQLVEMTQREEKLFIILDEILKGTNSKDKLNGSRRFLHKLLTLPVAGLVATHDLELGNLADTNPGNYFNRCFEITHTDNDIVYDYKLKPGISQNMNASILLEKMKLV